MLIEELKSFEDFGLDLLLLANSHESGPHDDEEMEIMALCEAREEEVEEKPRKKQEIS